MTATDPYTLTREEANQLAQILHQALSAAIRRNLRACREARVQPLPVAIPAGSRTRFPVHAYWPLTWDEPNRYALGKQTFDSGGNTYELKILGSLLHETWLHHGIQILADLVDGLLNLADAIAEQAATMEKDEAETPEIAEAWNRVRAVLGVDQLARA